MLTELQILKMAWHEALRIWSNEYDRYEKNHEDIIAKAHMERYGKYVDELTERMAVLEQGEEK